MILWKNFRAFQRGASHMISDRQGKILAIGGEELAQETVHWDAVYDLDRKFVTPGFWDSHMHLLEWGRSFERLILSPYDDMGQVLNIVKQRAREAAPGDWILGLGWNMESWGRFPRRYDLDTVCETLPVILWSRDLHTVWLNSKALARLHIDNHFEPMPGGLVDRDVHGQPTGILREHMAHWIYSQLPQPSPEQNIGYLKKAMQRANQLGLVGVTTVEGSPGLEAVMLLDDRLATLRIQLLILSDVLDYAGARRLGGSPYRRIIGSKIFVDGALGSQTAWMWSPYLNQGQTGMGILNVGEIEKAIYEAAARNLLLATHAIGDRAVSTTLDAWEKLVENPGTHGNRVEHAQLVRSQDIERFRKLGLAASMQPIHLIEDRALVERFWGSQRARQVIPTAQFVKAGIPVLLGSDAPVATPDIRLGLWASVYGTEPGNTTSWHPESRLSPEQAIKGYTISPAETDGRPSGALSPGLWADFTIWESDPYAALAEGDFERLKVMGTVTGGRWAYRA